MRMASAFTVVLSQGPSIFYKKIQVLRMAQSGQGHSQMGYRPVCEQELCKKQIYKFVMQMQYACYLLSPALIDRGCGSTGFSSHRFLV